MRKLNNLLVLTICLVLSTTVISQTKSKKININPDETRENHWVDMMKDLSVNFYDLQKEFNTYFKSRPTGKGTGWKQFKRWEHFMEQRVYPSGNRLNHSQVWNEVMKFRKEYPQEKYKSRSVWTPLGPSTSADVTGHWNPGIGRINVIARDCNLNIIKH